MSLTIEHGTAEATETPATPELVVLSSPTCHQCTTVVRHLQARGIPHRYIDVTSDPEYADLLAAHNIRAVPVTLREGAPREEWVMGFDPDGLGRLF